MAGASFAIPALGQGGPPSGGHGAGRQIGMMTTHGLNGIVTGINGSQISLEIPEGVTFTVETGSGTRVMKERQAASLGDLRVGDAVMASGEVDEQARTISAILLNVEGPESAKVLKGSQAQFGKSWTAGTVSAINGNAIDLKRRDGEMQTIKVDENTILLSHGESITMASVKVGQRVSAQINEKDGSFLASQLSVAGMMRGGRGFDRRGAGQGAATGTPAPQ